MAACGLCNDLRKRHQSHLQLSFDFTFQELSNKAEQQTCQPCLVIYNGLRQIKIDSWSLDVSTVSRVFARCHGEQGGQPDTLHLVVAFNDESPSLQLELYSLKITAWKAILPRPILSQNPLTEQAVTWARNHLDECKRTHVSCTERPGKQLPKRLLSLAKSEGGKMDVRLVEVKSSFSNISWAALSHCWGNERLLATTTRNLKIHKKSINWPLIPPTFMDAIKIAMALNIGYLWIDSLCILQDDLKDWEEESSKMADIYQYASVTLAATTASSSAQGAYAELSRVPKHTEIELPIELSNTCHIGIRERVRHWNKSTANDAAQFPLLSRGWVLQERLLSPRVLHFCDTELIWECRETTDCECGALSQDSSPGAIFYSLTKNFDKQKAQRFTASLEPLPSIWDRLRTKSPISKLRKSPSGSPSSSSGLVINSLSLSSGPMELKQLKTLSLSNPRTEVIPDFVPHYHRLVEQYSALKLTRASDRLPAFSGLSERMQHFRGFYLAGLWADSLCFDLMWRIDKHDLWETRSTRPLAYNGPSWSWVSSITAVQYWSDTINYTDTVQRFLYEQSYGGGKTTTPLLLKKSTTTHTIHVPGRNPFGFVESGVLILEASAVTATLAYSKYANLGHQPLTRHIMDINEYQLGYHAYIEDADIEGNIICVDIFADYTLNLKGPAEVCEGAELTLLLVHPDVALVLRRKVVGGEYKMIDGEMAWERIGITRVTTDSCDRHGYEITDWMKHSEVRKFKVV